MKIILFALLLLVPLTPVLACEGFEQSMSALEQAVGVKNGHPKAIFARELASSDELWDWAQKSTRGGARMEEATFNGHKLVFVYRSYTSGVKSSDAAVYAQSGNEWKLVKAYPVVMGKWIVADQQPEQVVFHPEGEATSLMTLSPADLASF